MHGGWERIAAREAGTVAGLANAGGSEVLLFAATSVGVFRSADQARTWTLPDTGSSVPFAEVLAVSARFAEDRTLFVGAAAGLYRSSDAGGTWQPVLVGSRMLSVTSALGSEGEGLILVGTEADGILRSDDSGRTWTGVNAGLVDLTVLALALSPAFDSDRLGFSGAASGLYRTRNGARSWRVVETGLDEPAVQCLAFSPAFASDRLIVAGTESQGLLRSTDAGSTWHVPPALAEHGITALAFSTRGTIAAATQAGVAVSDDGGETWRLGEMRPEVVLSLTFVASPGGRLLVAGTHQHGVLCSPDDGVTWIPANAGLNASLLTHLVLSPAFARDRTLFTAGLEEGVSVSVDGGRTWAARNDGLEEPAIQALALDDTTVYAATPSGIHVSRDRGASWQRGADVSESTRAVVVVPAQSAVLVALAGSRLVASNDRGASWRPFYAGFDDAEIISLAASPGGGIFVATSSAGETVLWRSTDGAAHWDRWLVGPEPRDALPLAVSSNDLVYVGLGNRVIGLPGTGGCELGGGVVAVTALAVGAGQTVFAATNAGVFVSRDAGESFQPWSEGLDQRRMVALAVSPSYADDRLVYGLGLGGTIWLRRDV